MPNVADVSHVVQGLLSDLRVITKNADQIVPRARFIARKVPAIREGLKTIGKSDKSEAISIGTFLENNARERPNAPALFFEDRVITHREFSELSNRYANLLAAHGVSKGDAVAILVDNRPEILIAVAGVVKLGAIAAVINTKQRKKVLHHSFSLCDASAYIVGEELWDAFCEVKGDLPNTDADKVFWVADGDDASCPGDCTDIGPELEKQSAATPAQLADVTFGDPCFYIYTSGTTGLPKASIMSHGRWIKASGAFGKLALNMRPEDVLYVPLPYYHNNALTVAWSSAAAAGAAMVIRRKFSVSKFWEDCRRYGATSFCYIGELCRYLMNQRETADDRHNPVRKIVGNGLRPDIWHEFKQRFDIPEVYEFYGASEANIAFVNVFNFDCTVGFCPAPYEIVKYDVDADEPVRDADGHLTRVGRGEVGLLISEVSEKYAFDGYTDPAASEKKLLRNVFADGDVWFNSGDLLRDLGFRHAQFVDRVGDTFRWKGENVSTNEVAEVLCGFRQVEEATVFGVQIPHTDGRAGMASIVATVPASDFDFDGLVSHMANELPVYARPLFVRFQEKLDITGTFKQKKGELKKQAFDVGAVSDPLYVLLPGETSYKKLTRELYDKIEASEYSF